MPKFSLALVGLALSLLPSAGQAADKFTFEDYFNGRTEAVGSFSAINGVKRTFTVDLTGSWDGKTLTLREDFVFDDGTKDRKTWRFTKTSPTTYSGTREDVIGETTVRLNGAVARFNYLVYLSPETQGNKVRFWDKMVLREDGTVLNTALVTKFGIPVAKTTVEFRKPGYSHKTASR